MKRDIFISLFWLLFSIYFTIESYSLGLGEWGRPGPGYFPFGAGLLFGILSLSVFAKALRSVPLNEISIQSSERFHWQNMVLIMFGMLAYILLLKRIGFVLCTFLLVVLFIRVIAKERWFKSIMTALAIALAFHLFFNILLNAQLPSGVFRFLRS
jgi:putative tricarboxylic transport membrane protein